jgi:hypothetical protein
VSRGISSGAVVALVAVAALVGAGGFWTAGIGGLVAANGLVSTLSASTGTDTDTGSDTDTDTEDEYAWGGDGAPLPYEIGDCFREPTDDMGHVQFKDCSEPHDYEVYSEFEVPDTPDGSYPGDDRMSYAADEGCLDAFEGFVGVPWDESSYDFAWVAPDEVTWTEYDDRLVQCLAVDPDGEHTGSLEGVGE